MLMFVQCTIYAPLCGQVNTKSEELVIYRQKISKFCYGVLDCNWCCDSHSYLQQRC